MRYVNFAIYFRVIFEGHFGDLLTVVTLCAQLTRDLLAIAKFLVSFSFIGLPVIFYINISILLLYRRAPGVSIC